ncbi:MAG: hypothetical protein KDJ97_34400 [Anaerolineae bacterium]|nr:hypothetical protein [Anaerolineae bacterium]
MLKSGVSSLAVIMTLVAFGLLVAAFLAVNSGVSMSGAPTFDPNPLLAPANGAILTDPSPTFDWLEATGGTGSVTYTLVITGPTATQSVTATASTYEVANPLSSGSYTWSVQAVDSTGAASGFVAPSAFSIQAAAQVYLPYLEKSACPVSSVAVYELIPFSGSPTDRPDSQHGDLNLALRGYNLTTAPKQLVNYSGGADSNAPRLAGLFNPNSLSAIPNVYRVNGWDWGCGAQGCATGPITDWDVTLLGLQTTQGQPIYIPERGPDIYGGGYKALVLYAEERRITLSYIREDTVAHGYAVHLENLCVDPNLLALYRSQIKSDGFRVGNQLPALRNDQSLGTALGSEIRVAVRDRGAFMDPRSCKDWWAKDVACSQGITIEKEHPTGPFREELSH